MNAAPVTHGLCLCKAQLDSDKLRCKACREAANERQNAVYEQRKSEGRCVWCNVHATINPLTGKPDQFCRKHRIARNKYLRDRKTARERKASK